ncbi:hypothetical protein BDR07DRAFT_842176 [Suillus spraguei]|nr:hypothetical protein BDR07DRAFT_842176 [Suillus spraguei]
MERACMYSYRGCPPHALLWCFCQLVRLLGLYSSSPTMWDTGHVKPHLCLINPASMSLSLPRRVFVSVHHMLIIQFTPIHALHSIQSLPNSVHGTIMTVPSAVGHPWQ